MSIRFLVLVVALLLSWTGVASPTALTVNLKRSAYYRGEDISLRVDFAKGDRPEAVELLATLTQEGVLAASVRTVVSDRVSVLRVPTRLARVGSYRLRVEAIAAGEPVADTEITVFVARRLNPRRMPVWLWPHRAFTNQMSRGDDRSREILDWWREHGFTNLAAGDPTTEAGRALWDYCLKTGLTVCVQPQGGLVVHGDAPVEGEGVYFDLGRPPAKAAHGDKPTYLNPFHPAVARWHEAQVAELMRAAQDYPHLTTAFFNTEVVDSIGLNRNEQGQRFLEEELGFDLDEVGESQFVAPAVIADNDRRYLLEKFTFTRGNGLAIANERTAQVVRRYRPDVLTMHDPFRSWALLDGVSGVDALGSWTYTNPDPKLMYYVETLRAACRGSRAIPLSTVTLLNYPGELAPDHRWMMMGPGRLAVTTWINLSRAPQMLGYYFSSNCDPFTPLSQKDLRTPDRAADADQLPPSTYQQFKALSEQVFQPFGELIRRAEVTPRRIAVLSSHASRLYSPGKPLRGHYANMQIYHLYTVLAMAQLPADVLFDETVVRYGLDGYDVLVLPRCEVLPESVYGAIREFQERGGLVVADQHLGPEIPDAIRLDFDFTYRSKVSAMAIAKGRQYAAWDDHLEPDAAALESVDGVTALQDQEILERYASRLRAALGDRVARDFDCAEPTALLSPLRAHGGRYLVVVNDKRAYGSRLGKHRAMLEDVVPQTVEVRVNAWDAPELVAYDLLTRKRLEVRRHGDAWLFPLELGTIGGTIVALYPRPLESLLLEAPAELRHGDEASVAIRLTSGGSGPVGLQPVRVTLTDPRGEAHPLSDVYCLENGVLALPLVVALNDESGLWRLDVEDLTAGLRQSVEFRVR